MAAIRNACQLAVVRLQWELDFQVKGYEVGAKAERGVALPEWYVREPIPSESTRFYIEAFWDLTTERAIGIVMGQIPSSRLRSYARRNGLQGGSMMLFRAVLRALDDAYLKHAAKRRKAAEG